MGVSEDPVARVILGRAGRSALGEIARLEILRCELRYGRRENRLFLLQTDGLEQLGLTITT